MKQFFGNKYVKGITQYIPTEHFGPKDYIDWYCEQMGLSREEYMAGYRTAMDMRFNEGKKKPGPDPYMTGLDDKTREEKEEQMKKQAKMDDDDPDAYKPMPGSAEARKKGKVKTSEFTKKYHELYGDDAKPLPEAVDPYYIDNAKYRLKNVYKHLGVEYGETRRGDKYVQINYIPVTRPQSQNPEWVNIFYDNDRDLKEISKELGMDLKESLNEEKAEGDRSPIDNPDIEKALKKKADETGVPIGILRIIMRRGMAAWKTGHRPGAGQEQWGYARVNAFLTKGEGTWGKADKDVAKEVRDGGHDKNLKKG